MSTRCPARAVHRDASDPGSSFTVVRIRHRVFEPGVFAPGTGSGAGDSVSPVGGACSWRRVRQVLKAAVTRCQEVAERQSFFRSVTSVTFRVMHPL
ncbi:hypothetical protein GCM10010255_45740 [Streptomyces coeruleofuscus]|uniref:Uncharacterized protein n=1 Tax=Streptomyces coeruleofuscus TaxID=66879 RepID=A0ABN3IIF6_9ACTN